jgi:hypothetical protein
MKIPISKSLLMERNDLVGYMEIPLNLADELAASFAAGVEFKLNACVQKDNDSFKLSYVTISAIPMTKSEI